MDKKSIGGFMKRLKELYNKYEESAYKTLKNSYNADSVTKEDIKNFVEKVAVFYELQLPDEVFRVTTETDLCNWIFASNEAVTTAKIAFAESNGCKWRNLPEDSTDYLSWMEFFNKQVLLSLITSWEENYLKYKGYTGTIDSEKFFSMHLHVDNDFVTSADGVYTSEEVYQAFGWESAIRVVGGNYNIERVLENHHLTDVYQTLTSINDLQFNPILASLVKNMKKRIEINEQHHLLIEYIKKAITCRIIERGGNRLGPRRALVFAHTWDSDLSIPMTFGVDTSDPYLADFIELYVALHGSLDIPVYVNCFSTSSIGQTKATLSDFYKYPVHKDKNVWKKALELK